MLLDEPFTGLDHRSTARLGARLGALRDEGRSLVLITHDLRQASDLANTALFVSRGRAVHRTSAGAEMSAAALESTYLEIAEGSSAAGRGGAAHEDAP